MTTPEPREDHELAACPFCDGNDAFVERASFSDCYVVCNDCGAKGPASCDENEADADASESGECEPGERPARRLWNRRPSLVAESTPTAAANTGRAELLEAAAGGMWYKRWFKAQVLNNELTAEIASLRAYIADTPETLSTPTDATAVEAEREVCAEVVRAAIELGLQAGRLSNALDGQEDYRLQRQAVLNAMKDLSTALDARTPKES